MQEVGAHSSLDQAATTTAQAFLALACLQYSCKCPALVYIYGSAWYVQVSCAAEGPRNAKRPAEAEAAANAPCLENAYPCPLGLVAATRSRKSKRA